MDTLKRIERPELLTRAQLDQYLAEGWYRVGQSLMTCGAVFINDAIRSAVWTRVPLEGYRFRKGLRRLLNRNRRNFRWEHTDARLDEEHEALYQRYLTYVDGSRAPTLAALLLDDRPDRGLFDTREIAIYDDDELVAFSWFDLGEESLQSITGVFVPEVASHSLGFTTMLLEIEHGIELGLDYFYAGYVLPGDPSMDYKLRTGHVEFLDDVTGDWLPWSQFEQYSPPVDRLRSHLSGMQEELESRGIGARIRSVPTFDLSAHLPELSFCLDQPLVLDCGQARDGGHLIVTSSLDGTYFEILNCFDVAVTSEAKDALPDLELLAIRNRIGPWRSVSALAVAASRLVQRWQK